MEKCEHYWIIPNSAVGRCQGMCCKCHTRKEFLNAMPENDTRESPVLQTVRIVTKDYLIAETADE